MSHLPFDARSILEYLNELGYRNITAGQLKEFMKGMQSQSELNQSSKQRKSNNFNTTGEGSRVSAKKSEQTQQRKHCKLVKGKRPLERYTFYLDIKDHQQSRKVEEVITKLGGSLDFFLTPNVTHFITDKEISPANNICNQNKNNNFVTRPKTPQTPATPETPLTPYSYDQTDGKSKPINNHNRLNAGVSGGSVGVCGVGGVTCSNNKFGKQSRADAMLNRARRSQNSFTSNEQQLHLNLSQQQQTILASNNKQQLQTALSYIIWDTDYALRFFTKVAFDLKKYLENSASKKVNGSLSSEKGACEPILFKNHFIKIESIQRNCRPYYQLWKKVCDWPKIELMREDGAFRHSPPANRTRQPSTPKQKQNNSRKMTRKSRSSTNRHAAAASVRKINQEEKSCIPGQEQQTKKDQQQQSTDRQCGVCEICKIEYDALTIHLKTKDHEIFAKNTENFLALDSLIKTSASVNKFLDRSKKSHNPVVDISAKVKIENELETSNKDLDDGKPIEKRKSKRNGKGSKSFSEEQSPTIPKKSKLSPSKRSTSFIELKDIGVEANVNSPKKCNNKTNPTVSPPIRPMLPTSSLYKVVESKESYLLPKATGRLTNTQGTTASVGSPSLIVKIRKVRQTELSILNGEAENFMFPKSRISETPTDVDRHTTSENTRQSSSSLSSSDRASEIDIRTEETHTIQNEPQRASISAKRRLHKLNTNDCSNKKALILASNKSISDICQQQSFPNTPIQPVVTASSSPPPAPIDSFGKKRTKLSPKESSFFEVATRKSSRTSTAIVTAATNSSRLLRATVENCRRSNRSRKQRYRLPLEDGMGDSMKDGSEEDDEDHDLDHGSDDDDEDEDFVINVRKKASHSHTNKKSPKKSKQYPKIFDIKTGKQLPHLKYSFERLPCSESWYEVFTRQDNGTEKMFEFFGSTAYRKLPYEMGPIPFSYTSSGSNNSCRLCHQLPTATETGNHLEKEGEDIETEMVVSEQDIPQLCSKINCKNEPPADPPPSKFEQEQPHAYHKHKKHHLYRYRQEQEQLQKQTFKEELSVLSHSKDSTPDPAESTLSNSSSCPSNLSCTSSKKIRNKFLNKSTFLNLDLPPRKSPREHASTLAILSCIIKQRQDSLSKPSSDVDGPSPVPTTPGAVVEEKPLLEPSIFQQALPSTRKQSTTPIEEMRFVSEISENVKRLRRGVNKYDEVPLARSLNVRQLRVLEHQKGSAQAKMKKTPKFIRDHSKSRKNNRRQNCTPAMLQYRSPFEFPPQVKRSLTTKKKTGLEFELDASALKALEKTMQETSATQLEREIDHYLEMSAFNVNEQSCETIMDIETPPESENSGPMVQKRKKSYKIPNNKPRIDDCFSSDVDLIDLIENPINGSDEDCDETVSRGFDVGITESCATRLRDRRSGGRQSIFNFFSSSQNYFKKRKYLKANRTGWPKNKKKITARQQFQQDIKNETIRISCEGSDHLAGEGEEGPEKREHSKNSRCVVITPPDTDIDDTLLRAIASNTSSIPDEEEIDEVEVNEKVSCTRENDDDDGYEEEEEDEDDAATAEGDEEQMEATPSSTTTLPPAILCKEETMTTNPSTPLINGYLSPSEKADNSDIFTVSSDGLETDLDLSNSQLNKTVEIDGGEDIAEGERTLGSALRITSSSQKKKLDVSKLAISNNRRTMTTTYPSTTTATVATNPTTLAISNILKKEVKVSCRRLRAPFRRYRYRR